MVCMRSLVRRVKVHVIHKLTHQIKMYRSKKGTEEQKAENCRKADRLLAEIQVIRNLNLDRVSKFALHNTLTIRDVKPQMDQEQKALLRLACQKAMNQHVTKWRAEHEDWKSLAAFLLTKTGRRLKRKKKTKSESKPPQPKKRKTKEKSDVLNNTTETSCPSAKDDQTDIEILIEEHELDKQSKNTKLAVSSKTTRKSKKPNKTSKIKIPNQIDTIEKQLKPDSTVSCKVAKVLPEDSDISDTETAEVDAALPNTVQRDHFIVKQHSSHTTDDLSSTKIVKSKRTSEMVVQTINLEDVGDDTDNFFVLPGEPAEKDTAEDTKPDDDVTEDTDSFFVFGDEHSHIETSEQHLEDDPEAEAEDREGSLARGREMLTSTFIGALCHRKKGRRHLKQSDIRNRPAWDEKKFLKDGSRNKNSTTDRPKNLKFGSDRPHKDMTKWKGTINKQLQTTNKDETHVPSSTEALHPSWEASRKRKQQQIGIPSFQGKKTTFDDSD